MKILNLSITAGKARGGGAGEVASSFTKYQNNLGNDSSLWFPGYKSEEIELINDLQINKGRIRALETLGNPNLGLAYKTYLQYNEIIHEFDILHQHGIWLPISCITKKISGKKTMPVIISPHGFLEPERLLISKYKKKFALLFYERANLNQANCIIACSKKEADNLLLFGLKNPIAVIPNGISTQFFHSKGNALRFKSKFHIPGDKRNMLFLSRIHPLKGLNFLFTVLGKIRREFFKNWILTIGGIDEMNHVNELKNLAMDLKIDEHIHFVGPLHGQDKVDAFEAADFFVLPSMNENFGIVVIEALSKGIPVLTTTDTPWEQLNTENCGYCVERKSQIFEETLLRIIDESDTTHKKMGEFGRNLVQREYIWDNIVYKTIDLYRWLLRVDHKPGFIIN